MIGFSGRFDPIHPGHLAQVKRLQKVHGHVHVIILDYDSRKFPVEYIKKIFLEILGSEFLKVSINKTHFGEISLHEWANFGCNRYGGGNLKVNRHMERLGVDTFYVDRAYDFSARDYPAPL